MFRAHRSLIVALPVTAFLGLLAAGSAGCSGSSNQGMNGNGEPTPTHSASTTADFPCCHGGFIYKCASEDALAVCSDATANDTTDCAKTATACGGEAKPAPSASSSSSSKPAPPPPPPKKKTGESCTAPGECEGGLCLVFGSGTVGFCSKTCANVSECPGQYRCELVSGLGSKACSPIGDGKLGDSCTYGPECASNLCIVPTAGGKGYCSATCNAPVDCGPNWTCDPLQGGAGKYCQH